MSSFLVCVRGGKWEIVPGLPINDFSRSKIDASAAELKEGEVARRRINWELISGMFPVENFHRFWQAGAFDGLEIFHQIPPD
jgi:hypothetical protein